MRIISPSIGVELLKVIFKGVICRSIAARITAGKRKRSASSSAKNLILFSLHDLSGVRGMGLFDMFKKRQFFFSGIRKKLIIKLGNLVEDLAQMHKLFFFTCVFNEHVFGKQG